MLNFLSKIFGGNKSQKDVERINPIVEQINKHFNSFSSLSNDELRGKTVVFQQRSKKALLKSTSRSKA